MDCREAQRLIEKLYVEADPGLLGRVRGHLGECVRCSQAYERIYRADASLAAAPGSEPPAISRSEAMLVEAQVLGAAAATSRRPLLRPILGLATALAAAAVVLVLVPARAPQPLTTPALTARGAASTTQAKQAAEPVGLRALCLKKTAQGLSVQSINAAPAPGDRPTCSVRDRLGLTYRNETTRGLRLWVFAIARSQVIEIVKDELASPDESDTPLAASLILGALGSGRAQLLGVFSSRSLVAANLIAAARSQRPLGALKDAGAEHVVELTVEIGE